MSYSKNYSEIELKIFGEATCDSVVKLMFQFVEEFISNHCTCFKKLFPYRSSKGKIMKAFCLFFLLVFTRMYATK